MPKVGQEFRTP